MGLIGLHSYVERAGAISTLAARFSWYAASPQLQLMRRATLAHFVNQTIVGSGPCGPSKLSRGAL
jgi:hypothetical protein